MLGQAYEELIFTSYNLRVKINLCSRKSDKRTGTVNLFQQQIKSKRMSDTLKSFPTSLRRHQLYQWVSKLLK